MKQIKLSQIAAVVAAVGIVSAGIGAVYAASDTAGSPMSGLVSAIASKFGLNESDVQAVFDEQKSKMEEERKSQMAEMQAKRQQEFADNLSQAVADGKVTQEQADLITAKKAEMESQRSDSENMDRETMEKQMASLKQWAKDNNIPEEYLFWGGVRAKGVFGTVSAMSGTTITLVSRQPDKDAGTATDIEYTVNAASATVKKIENGADGKKTDESTITIGDIKVGDKLSVRGTIEGTVVAASEIIVGDMTGGRRGHGPGFGGPQD